MTVVEQNFADLEAIKQLKARYFRYVDTKRWTQYRQLFTDDARFEGTNVTSSVDDFVASLVERHAHSVTVHHGHMPEIVLTGATSARGIWAMQDWVEFPALIRKGPAAGYFGFVGNGHYEEEYRKEGGEWRIAFMRLTRLKMTPIEQPTKQLERVLPSSTMAWLAIASH